MSVEAATPELRAKWEPVSGIVQCDCGMAIIADDTPGQFSREIAQHALSHSERTVDAGGVMEFAKFLADTRE